MDAPWSRLSDDIPADAENGRATASRIKKGGPSPKLLLNSKAHTEADDADPSSRRRAKRVHREAPIQQAIVSYLRKALPSSSIVHHNRNEIAHSGKSFRNEIARAKAHGMVKGFPDLTVIYPGGVCFFEVKAEGNYADADQKALHEKLMDAGQRIAVVRSIDGVRDRLNAWGIPHRDLT